MSNYNPFYDDVKERNAMKSGAYHKKNGAQSRKCTLPSDSLTDAQRRKLNGPCKTYVMHLPMTWAEFKAVPTDIQQAHLDYIQRRFRIGATTISTEVFGLGKDALPQYMKRAGLNLASYRGHTPDFTALRAWVNGTDNTPPDTTETEEPEAPVLVDAPVEEPPVAVVHGTCDPALSIVKNCRAEMSGTAEELICALRELLGGRDAHLTVRINFE